MKKSMILQLLRLAVVLTWVLAMSACAPAATLTPEPAATATPKPAETPTVAAPTPAPTGPKRGGILGFGVKGETSGFDLQKISLTAGKIMFDQLYAGLVDFDAELNSVPRLAESWEMSDDGLTYVFHLRPGLKFSNGEDLTAEDVKFTFERILDPDTGSPWRPYYTPIDTIEATDETTVVFHLSEPSGGMLGYLAHQGAGILPKDYIEGGGDINLEPVGAGAFRLKEWIPEYHALMEANPYYYEEGIPYLDGIEFTFTMDDSARASAVRAGEVHFLQRAPMVEFGEIFEEDPNLKIIGGEMGEFRQLILNNTREPFDDWRVRQAIAWAVDREAICAVTNGEWAVIEDSGPIPPPHWAHVEEPYFYQDYEKARELLGEAGYPDGFKMAIMTVKGEAYNIRPAQMFAEQVKPLGIEVEVDVVESTVLNDRRARLDFDATNYGWSGLVDPDQYMAFFLSDGPANFSGFADPHFDALAAQGRQELDREERAKIYREAQKYLCEKSPVIFYCAFRFPDVVRAEVNTDQFHFMYDWSYKTARYLWFEE